MKQIFAWLSEMENDTEMETWARKGSLNGTLYHAIGFDTFLTRWCWRVCLVERNVDRWALSIDFFMMGYVCFRPVDKSERSFVNRQWMIEQANLLAHYAAIAQVQAVAAKFWEGIIIHQLAGMCTVNHNLCWCIEWLPLLGIYVWEFDVVIGLVNPVDSGSWWIRNKIRDLLLQQLIDCSWFYKHIAHNPIGPLYLLWTA